MHKNEACNGKVAGLGLSISLKNIYRRRKYLRRNFGVHFLWEENPKFCRLQRNRGICLYSIGKKDNF